MEVAACRWCCEGLILVSWVESSGYQGTFIFKILRGMGGCMPAGCAMCA